MGISQPDGYLAMPEQGNTGQPVLVLHAWWGLNATLKAFCDRLAAAGFVAFAPDLYHGTVTDQIDEAEALVAALAERADQARAQLAHAAAFLRALAHSAPEGLAAVGFSLGAFYALDLSASDPERVRKVVLFYGTGPADFQKSQAAYLGHFAANDPFEPQSSVAALESALRQAGRPVTFYSYPETGHWFFEPDRTDAHNPAAAALAWERTLAFLQTSSGV
ncbi:MAG: dienelactone hydrolase family protein [Anaerolineae bacterium]|nr:dienelactone hydrolase family protein [Anaerolineae bacterium]